MLDIVEFEKVFYLARKKIKYGPFLESSDLMNPIGCNTDQLKDIMNFCGYETISLVNDRNLYFFKQNKKIVKKNITNSKNKVNKTKIKKINKRSDPNSPFAVLEKLL